MRGGFSYRPSTARGGRRKLLATTLLVVVLLLLDLISGGKLRAALRGGAAYLSSGANTMYTAVANNTYFTSRSALESQVLALTFQIAQYQERAAAYDALKTQYAALAQMTHLAQTSPGVTAPIISSLSASPYGTFSVGAGQSDGVSTGDLVLSSEGFVIGDVAGVGAHVSLVNELFAPGRTVDATVHGANVTLTGAGGENAHAQVPRGVAVAVGDPVTAPQYGGRAIGIVGNVASSSASAYSDVIINFPVNLNILRYVYVTPKH